MTNRFNQRPLLQETGGMLGMLFQMEPNLSITTLSISISIPTSSNMATFILGTLWPKSFPKSHLIGLQTKHLSFLCELARLCHSKGEARYYTEKDLQVHSFQWSSLGLKFIRIKTCEQSRASDSCMGYSVTWILQSRLKFEPRNHQKQTFLRAEIWLFSRTV